MIRKIPIYLASSFVVLCLLYYGEKYYKQTELYFQQNQLAIFTIFSLIVFWLIGLLWYKMAQVEKQSIQLKEITEDMGLILTKVQQNVVEIKQDQFYINDEQIKLHRFTQQLLMGLNEPLEPSERE